MKTTLLSFSALAMMTLGSIPVGLVAANVDQKSAPSRTELISGSALHLPAQTGPVMLRQARSGHGGEEEEYFKKKHRLDRNNRSG